MAVSAVSNITFIGVTRIAFNYILIKSSMLCSASILILSIFVGGRLESLLVVVCLCLGTYLILKSNNRIQASYLVINTPSRSISDLLS